MRQIGRFSIRIWQIMLFGALLTLITGQISPQNALLAIDQGVMIFLFGMFIVGEGVKKSGILEDCMNWISHHARSGDLLLVLIILTMGFLSTVLMNDTIAIVGAPLILILADRFQVSKTGAMIALCLSVTTGSVFSPIGNPQNYLIAASVPQLSPYVLFFSGLIIPTIISLGIVFLFLRPLFQSVTIPKNNSAMPELMKKMARWPVYLSFALIFIGIGTQIVYGISGVGWPIPIAWVAIGAAIPVVICSSERFQVIRDIDWYTLIFFAAMFVLMQSVYDTGFFQDFMPTSENADILLILTTGIVFSQFISNVPFVALFQPALLSPDVSPSVVLALAAGSTIAGNLTILGAASNVIIIQQAENRGVHISMTQFCTYGIPVTLCQMCVYAVFLMYGPHSWV